jgi:hypothetical protein
VATLPGWSKEMPSDMYSGACPNSAVGVCLQNVLSVKLFCPFSHFVLPVRLLSLSITFGAPRVANCTGTSFRACRHVLAHLHTRSYSYAHTRTRIFVTDDVFR